MKTTRNTQTGMDNTNGKGTQVSRQPSEASRGSIAGGRLLRIGAAATCAALVALALVASASAKVVELYVYNGVYPAGSFDGTGSVGGPAPFSFGLQSMDINQETGDAFVGSTRSGGLIYKFNSAGVAQTYSGLGLNTVITGAPTNGYGETMVDNSSSAGTKGRIFQWGEFGAVNGYLPSGLGIGGNFPLEGTGDNCGGDVGPNGNLWITTWGSGIQQYNPAGVASSEGPAGGFIPANGTCNFAIDGAENFFTVSYNDHNVRKFNNAGVLQDESQPGGLPGGILENNQGQEEPTNIAIDRSNGNIFIDHGSVINEYDSSGSLLSVIGESGGGYPGLSNSQGLAVNSTTHKLYATSESRVDTFVQTGPITIPNVTTGGVSVTETSGTVNGTVDPDAANGGTAIEDCRFEWGTSAQYGNFVPCDQAPPINELKEVTATIPGLTQGQQYHYRIAAASSNGVFSKGTDRTFRPAGPPVISEESVSDVNTDGAKISAKIDPNGGDTTYYVEFGTTEAYGGKLPEPEGALSKNEGIANIAVSLTGLTPGTPYHFRVVATNANSTTFGPDGEFTTFPTNPSGPDPCTNAQVRQQTGASLLLDCRAYELTSAPNTGGYDVQSDLIPGQQVFTPQPGAPDRVLYSVHFGTIPGTGDPTNLGADPYVATRGTAGWNTAYVGIPASGTPSEEPFGSPLADSAGTLGTFAFGGANLCDPCFEDGSTGIPVRMPNGSLVQGMKGSLNPVGATPAGHIGKGLSADGSHLVFGSESKFEPDGLTGEIAIYDRDLNAGVTHVVSKKSTADETMKEEGQEIGEVDISDNGSRILIGKLVSTDSAGNMYWHLYMNVGDASRTIDLTPGTTSGVLFDGMTGDGTKVFFTTPDELGGGDTDSSADIYRADVTTSTSSLTKITNTNSDACSPVAGKEGPHWNTVSGSANCDAVAFAGGAGVASADGTIYFLSPEELDGSGTLNEANLFVAEPGDSPHFVATLEADGQQVRNAVYDNEVHRFSDFQVTPNGDDAVFASRVPLTEFNSLEHSEVFRYDSPSDDLVCVSCAITGAAATGDASLSNGLNLANDGRVFFTSSEPLVLRDTNGLRDAYEWEEVEGEGVQQLISTGTSNFDSGLLSVSSDGVNAYFFTRATLVPQDENGSLMKIYDARENGGFLVLPTPKECAASDECHGPGTQPGPAPQIGTFEGKGGNHRQNCNALSSKAKKESKRAKKLRRKAKGATGKKKKSLNKRANQAAGNAKRKNRSAKQCRASAGRSG
jgi:hypothetical protein